MQCKYRTPHGWDNKEYATIVVDQMESGPFILLGYNKKSVSEFDEPVFGVTDVLEFEVFEDE